VGGVWLKPWWVTRTALRRALAMLGVVATLAAIVPAVPAGAAAPDGTSGSAQSSDVNRNAVEPKAPRQQDFSAPAPSRDNLGPAPQPVSIVDRVERATDAAPRPAFTTRATSLIAAKATIAAQPRAPPQQDLTPAA
jgi:hypothetical protein